ncbi:lysozyme [Aurantiacibacter aquimixticola]|uniref:Lysozyme n=1 Tax=Aurantiacibacter aquimixticola TaxID=1958945 RepID=A0A419RTC7_9SPHN|nr:lysozyme [Aurantiacibacter aquimixticola]RJY09029.1 lysozyme [Aurantiacibacter aquimixticola]
MDRKPLFDLIRTLIQRPFRQSEVDALDDMLDGDAQISSQDTVTPVTPPAETVPGARRIGPAGIALIKRFEGLARKRADGTIAAYPDPGTGGEPWTIGWGATGRDHVTGGRIGPDTVWTQEEADARFLADVKRYAAEVDAAIGDTPTTQAQFDAMVSFHYNTGAIGKATLTRKHRAGDHAGAAREFDRWTYAGGRKLKGLARRRAAEAKLYRSG